MLPFNVLPPSSSLTTRCGESPTVTPSQLPMLRVSLQFKRIEVLIEPSRVALMVRSSTQSLTKAALSAGLGTTVPLVHCILCDGELPPPPPPPPPPPGSGWEAAGGGIISSGVGVSVGVGVIVGVNVGVGVGQYDKRGGCKKSFFLWLWGSPSLCFSVYGIQPVSRLPAILNVVRLVRVPSSSGMEPISWFPARLKVASWERLPNSLGIGPVSWLALRRNTNSWERLPNSVGIGPVSWFL